MRIVHVIQSLDPAGGGPPKIAVSLAAAQAARGHHVQLLHADAPEAQRDIDQMLAGIPGCDGLAMTNLGPRGGLAWLAGAASPAMTKAIDAADFAHLHSVWSPILPKAAKLCRSTDTPYLVLLNGMLDPWSLSQRSTKKKIALQLIYRKMLEGAAALHVGNVHERDLIAELNLDVATRVIPNGIFPEEVADRPTPGAFYQKLPALNDAPYVLFLSRLHYKKGLDHLAEIFAKFAERNRKAHLVVAGPDGGARADFEQRIAGYQLNDRVHVTGPLYGDDKRKALTDAACFILPSHQEGFSVAITEALAWSLPCVVTEGCHFPEVAENEAGYVCPLDDQRLADALTGLFSDESRRRAMGENGHRYAMDNLIWPKIADQTIEIYKELSAGPP